MVKLENCRYSEKDLKTYMQEKHLNEQKCN